MKRIVVLAGARSDTHCVGLRLARGLLEDAGYQVVYLGAATPLEEVASATMQNGATAAVIASTNGHSSTDLAPIVALRRSGLLALPVLVGGRPAVDGDPTGRAVRALLKLGVAAVLQSLDELVPALDACHRPVERRLRAASK